MDFYRLIEEFRKYYYTTLLMLIVELAALIIGLLYVRKEKAGRFFITYIAFDFCILLAVLYMETNLRISRTFHSYFQDTTNTLVAYVELLVYFYFFKKVLKGNRIKVILTRLAVIYSVIIIIFLATKFVFDTNRYSYIAYITGAIEFIFLLVPCIYYFLHLFKANSSLPLTDRPSFWIVTGIFFFSLISIPYYLLNRYFFSTQYELRYLFNAVLYYIPFTANFIFLIKAFLCKKTLTI